MSHRHRINAEIIDALLARPQGVSVGEACDECPATGPRAMLKRLQHLVEYAHTAWTARTPGALAHRWFSSLAARDAWQAANPPTPTRAEIKRLARQAKGPSLRNRLMAVVDERGGHGTLPSDLSSAIDRPSGSVGSWVTDMEQRNLLCSVMYRGIRIVHPLGVRLNPAALQACQRRIDRELATRHTRISHTTSITKAKAGLPAGVTLPVRDDWRSRVASNGGQVAPSIMPSPWYDRRVQIDPLTRVVGGFRDMGPGQYDTPPSAAVAALLAARRAA
jgi:hypothetical protein